MNICRMNRIQAVVLAGKRLVLRLAKTEGSYQKYITSEVKLNELRYESIAAILHHVDLWNDQVS